MIAVAYVDRDQLEYERGMERWRERMLGEGRCAACEQVVEVAGTTLAGMLVCVECAEQAADAGVIGRTLL